MNRRTLARALVLAGGLAPIPIVSGRAQGTPVASPAASPVGGDTPVGQQFAWVLDTLNGGAGPAEADTEARFAEDFLSAVPVTEITALFGQLAAMAPYQVTDYSEDDDGLRAQALLTANSGDGLDVSIEVEPDEPHRIVGLCFQPAAAGTPVALTSWQEFEQQWAALAPAANFLAAEIVDGECVPVHGLHPDLRLGVGSVFKLYILGELANQVRTGAVTWDDPLAIRDDWRVPFSGDMNTLAAGEERTLRQFAEQMISVSDNTATDHLLFHLGRENVEAIQAEMGHGDPAVNTPMLSTYELFKLKLAAPENVLNEYLAAPPAEKRALLETEIAGLMISPEQGAQQRAPILIDRIEWFISPEEICRALATLDAWSREPGLEPVAEILSINPGLEFDPEVWPYVGFKGGSELGVLNGSWLLGRSDERRFVLTAGLNNTEAPIDERAAFQVLQAAAELLAETTE